MEPSRRRCGQVPVGGLWRAKSNRCGGVATRTSQTSTGRRAIEFLAPIDFANPVVDGESQAGGGQSLLMVHKLAMHLGGQRLDALAQFFHHRCDLRVLLYQCDELRRLLGGQP